MTELDLLQGIYDRLGELIPIANSIYSLLGFTVVVAGAAVVIYFVLRPLLYFLR